MYAEIHNSFYGIDFYWRTLHTGIVLPFSLKFWKFVCVCVCVWVALLREGQTNTVYIRCLVRIHRNGSSGSKCAICDCVVVEGENTTQSLNMTTVADATSPTTTPSDAVTIATLNFIFIGVTVANLLAMIARLWFLSNHSFTPACLPACCVFEKVI